MKGAPLRRMVLLAIFVVLMPQQWAQVTGCDASSPLQTASGLDVIAHDENAVTHVLVIFGAMVFSIISGWLSQGGGVWRAVVPQIVATLSTAYATFYLHFILTFDLFTTTTLRGFAYAALAVLVAMTLDALGCVWLALDRRKQKGAP